jgi:hypothetical protein
MAKYKPLTEHLTGLRSRSLSISFSDIEDLIGASLPNGAREKRSWWDNDEDKGHSAAWMVAGWEVADVDMEGQRVNLKRTGAIANDNEAGENPLGRAQSQAQALIETGVDQVNDLVRQAMPTLKRYGPYIALGAVAAAAAAAAALVFLRDNDEG